jgi:hypothetical protein
LVGGGGGGGGLTQRSHVHVRPVEDHVCITHTGGATDMEMCVRGEGGVCVCVRVWVWGGGGGGRGGAMVVCLVHMCGGGGGGLIQMTYALRIASK